MSRILGVDHEVITSSPGENIFSVYRTTLKRLLGPKEDPESEHRKRQSDWWQASRCSRSVQSAKSHVQIASRDRGETLFIIRWLGFSWQRLGVSFLPSQLQLFPQVREASTILFRSHHIFANGQLQCFGSLCAIPPGKIEQRLSPGAYHVPEPRD